LTKITIKQFINNTTTIWHILNEDNRQQDREKDVRTTTQNCLQWQFAPIVEHGTFITPCAVSVVTTEEN